MKEEPNPTPQDSTQSQGAPGAPVANMGMSQAMGQINMGQPNMTPNLGQQGMSQANLADMGQTSMGHQQGIAQANMSQQSMSHASMAQQAQQIAQMDMSNIDPSIGLQQMGGMNPMGNLGNMGNMSAHGRGMGMQGGQLRNEKIDEMPQDM